MKILLVQPVKPEKALGGEDFAIYEPLALEYLPPGLPVTMTSASWTCGSIMTWTLSSVSTVRMLSASHHIPFT